MGIENPKINIPPQENEETKESVSNLTAWDKVKNKAKSAAAALGAAAAIGATAGCEPPGDNVTKEEVVKDPDFQKFEREWSAYEKKDEDLIKSYFEHVESGHFPASSKNAETLARARSIAQKKGFEVLDTDGIEVASSFNVPVQIKVKGQIVPVGPQDYTKRELELVRTAEMVGEQMGGAIANSNESVKAPEKQNAAEVRKSKSDF